jgi:hypothetical protein
LALRRNDESISRKGAKKRKDAKKNKDLAEESSRKPIQRTLFFALLALLCVFA